MSQSPAITPMLLPPCLLSVVRHQHCSDIQQVDESLQRQHEALLLSVQQQYEHQLQALQSRRLQALNGIRVACCIDHLPAELIVEIFWYLVGPRFPGQWSIHDTRAMNTIMLVCGRWAAVARSYQNFWRCLRVFIANPENTESDSASLIHNNTFEPHLMLFRRLRMTEEMSVEVDIGTISTTYHDPGLVPVLTSHAWHLERLSVALCASALWHLGGKYIFSVA